MLIFKFNDNYLPWRKGEYKVKNIYYKWQNIGQGILNILYSLLNCSFSHSNPEFCPEPKYLPCFLCDHS